jgi:methenyltetrahydromethanopterin cyclohydrolase
MDEEILRLTGWEEIDTVNDEQGAAALNDQAWDLVHQILAEADELRIDPVTGHGPGVVIDFGVETTGSLAAGLALAEVCTSGLADFSILPGTVDRVGWPYLQIQTDYPLEACLLSQYAGWRLKVNDYFAMASGPMRASSGLEDLFRQLEYTEEGYGVVGVLESSSLPGRDVINYVARTCGVAPEHVALLVAPTASLAGNLQVVGRVVETALHKLYELGFDVTRVESACGWAPIPPVADEDIIGIGRTNDAILYGGRVTLWVEGDDTSIREIGPRIPSSSSSMYGKGFLEIFESTGRDFYQIDPLLFSPAEIVIHNIETGRVHHFGQVNESMLRSSFGF